MFRTSRRRRTQTGLAALLAVIVIGLTACTGHGSPAHRNTRTTHATGSTGLVPARTVAKDCSTALPGGRRGGHQPRRAGWRISPQLVGGIEGFANRTSAVPGDRVTLYVSTDAPRFLVRAFRVGAQCREVWKSRWLPGRHQAPAKLGPAVTATMYAPWRPSLTLSTANWPPGDYLLLLETTRGRASYVPLTVRTPSAAGRLVLISSVTTWQAYNLWGCCDLYAGGNGSFDTRSRAVSFDRPYLEEGGAGEFIRNELPVVMLAEQLRLPLDYVTDVDLQQYPNLLDGARAVISMGHDEYWSPQMRAALTRARDAGTNIAFLGGNGMFRRIRFASTALGPNRLEINYKIATEDPLYGVNNAEVTANWPAPPDPQPESSLLGAQYACNLGLNANVAGVIVEPRSWIFAGGHVTAGQKLAGLIGPETDAVQLGYPTPRPIEVLLHTPTACPSGGPHYADTSYYVARSGAGVFDAGTIAWSCSVNGSCAYPIPAATARVVRAATANILKVFSAGPAGRQHAAVDNLAEVGIH